MWKGPKGNAGVTVAAVKMKAKTAFVCLNVFSDKGGFSKLRVEVSCEFPHIILRWIVKTKPYLCCRIMF